MQKKQFVMVLKIMYKNKGLPSHMGSQGYIDLCFYGPQHQLTLCSHIYYTLRVPDNYPAFASTQLLIAPRPMDGWPG